MQNKKRDLIVNDFRVEECREKFYQLHEYLVKSMQNDKFLIKKARQLKEVFSLIKNSELG